MTKIMERKTLRSPSLTGAPNFKIIYEAVIDKKDQNLPEKIYYNESYKDKTTIR